MPLSEVARHQILQPDPAATQTRLDQLARAMHDAVPSMCLSLYVLLLAAQDGKDESEWHGRLIETKPSGHPKWPDNPVPVLRPLGDVHVQAVRHMLTTILREGSVRLRINLQREDWPIIEPWSILYADSFLRQLNALSLTWAPYVDFGDFLRRLPVDGPGVENRPYAEVELNVDIGGWVAAQRERKR